MATATTASLEWPLVNGYKLENEIGGGGFSTVFRAFNLEQHHVAACKVIRLTPETPQEQRKTFAREAQIHSIMKHTNVLEFFGHLTVEPDSSLQFFPAIYMLLELASGGDLFDKIAPNVGMDEEMAIHYFVQLVSGVLYIHGIGICHRDLKPENILLDAVGTLKISDFGLSTVFRYKGSNRLLKDVCGSLPYVAPELSTYQPYRAEPIDVWGIGVILFTFLTGNTPWDEPTEHSFEYRAYLSGEYMKQDPWNRLSEEALDLLRALLTVNPTKRVTLKDVPAHPWMHRPTQIDQHDPIQLAEKLTRSLRDCGDLALAEPHGVGVDADGDVPMESLQRSQFTQSLMLFSQTQSGSRYTPHLTRFYSSLTPEPLAECIIAALQAMNVKLEDRTTATEREEEGIRRIRVGGFDARREKFKGWVRIENFIWQGSAGSFVVMMRDQGNPISWRQLWKALITHEHVHPHVLRRH